MNKDTRVKFNIEYDEFISKKNNETYKKLNINVIDNEGVIHYVTSVFLKKQEESIIDLVSKTYK